MTEPASTGERVARPDEVVVESRPADRYQNTWSDYLVQAHDRDGRALFDAEGRPVLVAQGQQSSAHPLDRLSSYVLLVLVLLLIAMCVIGGIALHDLDAIRGGGGSFS